MAVRPVARVSVGPFGGSSKKAAPIEDSGLGGNSAYVISQFREFYDEVQELRRLALMSARSDPAQDRSFMAPPPPPDDGAPPLPGFAAPPLPVREDGEDDLAADEDVAEDESQKPTIGLTAEEGLRRLQGLLEMQALEAGRRGGEYGVLYYREAEYVMAALGDEVFLNLDWTGRHYWRNDLLETRLFNTYNAGDEFFRRLDQLLKVGDRAKTDIAVIYLLALTFGFRGRYAGGRDEKRIAEYRRQLFSYIYERRPDMHSLEDRLVPEAYQHTQTNLTVRLLPSPGLWFWLLGAAVILYLLASHFVYQDALAPLMQALQDAGV